MNLPRHRVRRAKRRALLGIAVFGIPSILLAATSEAEPWDVSWALRMVSMGCILTALLAWLAYAVRRRSKA